ncbi:MAG TPA: hypothetical protein VHG28_07260, partial [Longimicrobiaceae bacterium]|nr:hypothetical protein [Longimicrobiaceae bacterium]
MNGFVCVLGADRAAEDHSIYAHAARLLRCTTGIDGVRPSIHIVTAGALHAAVAVQRDALRPLLGRHRGLLGIGDVRLDNR